MILPIVRGLDPSLILRPQCNYFGFGERVRTDVLQGQETDQDIVWELREQVARVVEGQIQRRLRYRDSDRRSNCS